MVDKPPIDESQTAANFTPNASVADVSLQMLGQALPRNIDAFTIHWWGKDATGNLLTNFDSVVGNFCNGSLQTSAHFVVEANRWACIVSPPDAAWACGNWEGNRTTISIECNPLQRDGDYQAIGWLVAWLREQYGDFPLLPHNHWVQTECPGTYDLVRIDTIAKQIAAGPSPVPAPAPVVVPKTKDDKVFFAKLANSDAVYLSNGIWYRYIQDPTTLNALEGIIGDSTVHVVPSLNVLGVPADYIASPNFKKDIFTGQSAIEVAAQTDFINRAAAATVAKIPAPANVAATVDANAVAGAVVTSLESKSWKLVN